jgi:hypothetical protein
MLKKCTKCGVLKDIALFGTKGMRRGKMRTSEACRVCEAKRKRAYNIKYPHKLKAKNVITHLVEEGKLMPPDNCSECHKECKPHAHHPDYSKPKFIVWLCISCHSKEHKKLREIMV